MKDFDSSHAYGPTSNELARAESPSETQTPRSYLGPLQREGWLSELPRDFQARIASMGRWSSVNPSQRVFSAGDAADGLFGLGSGSCDILMPVTGDEECAYRRVSRGFWLDDCALTPGKPRRVSVEAIGSSRIFYVPYESVLRSLAYHPRDWQHFCQLATMNDHYATVALSETLALPPKARILRLFMRLADENGLVAATQDELGRFAGVSRATLQRVLRGLVSDGTVSTRYGAIVVTNQDILDCELNKLNAGILRKL